MPKKVNAYAAAAATAPLAPLVIERRDPGRRDVEIDIEWSGICHSDIHQARDEWGGSIFPMVPGHEIVGRVTRVGRGVKRFKAGDRVGVGCMVDSCRSCPSCKRDLEQFCFKGAAYTYNSTEMDRKTPTHGGYAQSIVVDEAFVLRIPRKLDGPGVAPLLCAGITTYSPLRHWKVGKGQEVGVVGLGGLGHMGVKLAAAMGARVTMLSTSAAKEKDARRLGAKGFALTTEAETYRKLAGTFDFILDTISAQHDVNQYLRLLKVDGAMVMVGVPTEAVKVHAMSVIGGRKTLAGSLIGGIAETQEMLDFCGRHGITSDVEVIPVQKVNEAYERVLKSDVRYRFVIDARSLGTP